MVLILAGVYATHSRWINEEIDLAKGGFRQSKADYCDRTVGEPAYFFKRFQVAADKIVKWNTESVVSAIRELA